MTARTVRASSLPVLLALGGSAWAAPQLFVPLEQERTLVGDARVWGGVPEVADHDEDAAVDFEPWSAGVGAVAQQDGATATGGGWQDSAFSADGCVATGSAWGNGSSPFSTPAFADGEGHSNFVVTFAVAERVEYALTGTIAGFDNGSTLLRLRSGTRFLLNEQAYQDEIALDASGTLAPGEYELSILSGGLALGGPGVKDYASAEYDVTFQLLVPPAPGTVACLGVGCPCGNDAPDAGCANSTGNGGRITGIGSPSVAADDLVLTAAQLPPGSSVLFYMGSALTQAPFFDGLQCAGGHTFRFLGAIQTASAAGTAVLGPGVAAASGDLVEPGGTWHFHAWYRDFPVSPCGTGANLTSVYSVAFVP